MISGWLMVPGIVVVPLSLERGAWKLTKALPMSVVTRRRPVMVIRRRIVIVAVSRFVMVILMIRVTIVPPIEAMSALLSRIWFASPLTIFLVSVLTTWVPVAVGRSRSATRSSTSPLSTMGISVPGAPPQIVDVVLPLARVTAGFPERLDGPVRVPVEPLDEVSADEVAGPVRAVGAVDSHQRISILVQCSVHGVEEPTDDVVVWYLVSLGKYLEVCEVLLEDHSHMTSTFRQRGLSM